MYGLGDYLVLLDIFICGYMISVYTVCTVASIPVWVRLGGLFEKRRLWLVAMWMSCIGFGSLLFLGRVSDPRG